MDLLLFRKTNYCSRKQEEKKKRKKKTKILKISMTQNEHAVLTDSFVHRRMIRFSLTSFFFLYIFFWKINISAKQNNRSYVLSKSIFLRIFFRSIAGDIATKKNILSKRVFR